MNSIKAVWCVPLAALVMGRASAIELSIEPATIDSSLGDSIALALKISGLGTGTAPSLGVFDIDIGYDLTVLEFDAVTFGDPANGDQLDVLGLGAITSFSASVSGVLNVYELSLDSAADLDLLQLDSFVLGTVSFRAVGSGSSLVTLSINSVGDALGQPLDLSSIQDARVSVSGGADSIPEGKVWLSVVPLGLAALAWTMRRRAQTLR